MRLAVVRNQRLSRAQQFSYAFLAVAAMVLAYGCGLENRMIFHPSTLIEQTPKKVGLEFEDIFFKARDGVRLNGWFIPHPQARFTLVWFHGNAGNIGHRVDNIKLLHDNIQGNIFIFDYRGYGRSAGTPTEQGTYLDGDAALELIRGKLGKDEKIVLFGRSLGAAVAAEMATRGQFRGLILESPFLSIAEMARLFFPWLPIGAFLQTRYDVGETIRKVKLPVLVLHGDRDAVVPFEQGKLVFAAAPEPKKFFTIAGADHNDTYAVGGAAYYRQLKEFIESTDREAGRSP